MHLASPLLSHPLEEICANAPENKDQQPIVWPSSLAFVEGRSRQCKASLPGKEPQGQFIRRSAFTRRHRGIKTMFNRGPEQRKKGEWRGSISWRKMWTRSRCRGRWRTWSSCWGFAAGGDRSLAMTPDQSQRGRPPATFHSSCPFAGGLRCLIHAKPFYLAWRKKNTSRDLSRLYERMDGNLQIDNLHGNMFMLQGDAGCCRVLRGTHHALSLRMSRPSKE